MGSLPIPTAIDSFLIFINDDRVIVASLRVACGAPDLPAAAAGRRAALVPSWFPPELFSITFVKISKKIASLDYSRIARVHGRVESFFSIVYFYCNLRCFQYAIRFYDNVEIGTLCIFKLRMYLFIYRDFILLIFADF